MDEEGVILLLFFLLTGTASCLGSSCSLVSLKRKETRVKALSIPPGAPVKKVSDINPYVCNTEIHFDKFYDVNSTMVVLEP